jgi:hypothetical protein
MERYLVILKLITMIGGATNSMVVAQIEQDLIKVE